METSTVLIAFGLTLFAGLSTGIGSAIAFFARRTNTALLSLSLGLSAGVMIYVSFVELFAEANKALVHELGESRGNWVTVGAFFGGMLLIALVDKFVPSFENPHEIRKVEDLEDKKMAEGFRKLYRMGIMTAVALAIHNFPEGLATFVSALKDIKLGIPIAVAIAIHNIPEGIAVSVPIYYATGNKKKAFFYSFLSGLAEPVGALVGYFLLMPYFNDVVFGILFASVGGIMVFISLDELLPSAREYGEHHLSIYGLVAGMMIMAVSLLLL
ncbi:MAG: zinc transporter ZupT [bacterium]|nr:zinc transporter ZupT [bacterium]